MKSQCTMHIGAACVLSTIALTTQACRSQEETKEPAKAVEPKFDRLERAAFNQKAAELALPFFWIADDNGNGAIDPSELALLWGMGGTGREHWTDATAFTANFKQAYETMSASTEDPVGASTTEKERLALVRRELAQGKPTLLRTNFANGSPEDDDREEPRRGGGVIETLYAKATVPTLRVGSARTRQADCSRETRPLVRSARDRRGHKVQCAVDAPGKAIGALSRGAPGGSQVL